MAQEDNKDIESWAVIAVDLDEDPCEEDMESWSLVEEECLANKDIIEALIEDLEEQVSSATSNPEANLYDSGASRHISPFQHHFLTYCPINPRLITTADKVDILCHRKQRLTN